MSFSPNDPMPQAPVGAQDSTEKNDQNEPKKTFVDAGEQMKAGKCSNRSVSSSIAASSRGSVDDQVPEEKDIELAPAPINSEEQTMQRRFPNLESFSLPTLPQNEDYPISIESIQSGSWFSSFSRRRVITSCLGCLSSFVVLAIRLYLDRTPSAYLIHSVIILIDMLLIHLFTDSLWLSISGEAVTVVCFLSFHFTKQTVAELLETTVIAALCSFHMILARNKHMDRENQLADITRVLHSENMSLRSGGEFCTRRRRQITLELGDDFWDQRSVSELDRNSESDTESIEKNGGLVPVSRKHLMVCGKNFFHHFLDGSAGVMYTSFLGLIIDEFINLRGYSNK